MDKRKKSSGKKLSLRRKLNWKGFFIAIIIVIIVEVFAVKLLKTGDPHVPTPTEIAMSSWKTYTNNTMGFSLKVPPGWYSHKENIQGNKTEAVFSYPIDSNNASIWLPNQEAEVSVLRYPNNGKSVQEEAQQWIVETNQKHPNSFKKELKTMTLAGKPATVVESADGRMEFIYLVHGHYTYNITLGTPKTVPFSKYEKTFDQMLTTFSFTQ